MTNSVEVNGSWNFQNYGQNEYFVVVVGTPDDGAELHLDDVQGDPAPGGFVFMPNVPVQLQGVSRLSFADGHPDVTNTGFVHVPQRSGIKNLRPPGATVMTAVSDMVYMCIMPRTRSKLDEGDGNLLADPPRPYNSIVLDYDVIEADGQYNARPNTYYVPVLGGADVGGTPVPQFDAFEVERAGPINITLDPGAKVVAVWLTRGRV